jgi:hypothetical protein
VTASIAELTAGMSMEQRAALAGRVRAKTTRLRTIRECPTPADLAARFDTTFVRTPAVDLVSDRLRAVARTRDGRLVLSVPPQEMKTTSLRWLCLWLLVDDPDRRIVFASYAAGLARTSGRIIRSLVETFGDQVGLSLDRSHADAADWQIADHLGGLLAVGVGSSLTGRPSDVMIIDDPLRNQKDAMSSAVLPALHEWWESVARTRLAPGAPVVVVQTRWVEDDLAGRLSGQGWPAVNIPAQADGQTPDALNRPVGEYLESTRGRTAADWAKIRQDVGERTWAALYQGRPAPLEGGVFQRSWFDTWRVDRLPAGCLPPVVVVDPADNEGDGDEAGILLTAVHPESGRVFILDDLSAPMTVARWARVALLTCVRRDAPTLAYEQSLSRLRTRVREAWQILHQQAVALHRAKGNRGAAVDRLSRKDDSSETRAAIEQGVSELADADVDAIIRIGTAGPGLKPIPAKGSKDARMQWAAPLFETGRAVIVGHLPVLEHQATTWQVGMDSPDRVDAMVHAAALSGVASTTLGRADERVPTNSTSMRNRSAPRLTRSTRR